MAEGSDGAVTLLSPQEVGVFGLLSLSEVILESCITSVLFVTGTELSCDTLQLSGAQLRTDMSSQCTLGPVLTLELPVPVLVSARTLRCHCRQHQVLLGTRNGALIYTSKCGIKGLTTGISALKHTLQHSRLLSKKSPQICKIISIEAAEAKQIFLYFLLP